MTVFSFNAKTALELARKPLTRPNLPNLPNRSDDGGAGLGGLGELGRVRASDHEIAPAPASPEMTPEERTREHYEERAVMSEFDGRHADVKTLTGPRPKSLLLLAIGRTAVECW